VPELDVKDALLKRYQQIDPSALTERAFDYLSSINYRDIASLKSVDRSTVEFYDDYGLLITDFSYGSVSKSFNDMVAHEQTYSNSSPDDPLEATFTYAYTRQDSQALKFTEGLKIGTKAAVKAKLPLVGESSVEVSAEVSFSAEQTIATTSTTNWQFSEKITVKPETAVQARGFIRVAKLDAPFTCHVRVTDGKVLVWFLLKSGSYTELPIPITDMMTDEERSFVLSGNLSGSEAADAYVKVRPVEVQPLYQDVVAPNRRGLC
jgi:Clostridium epsilon toxin ETX/Bacillus mosquitocidal toxin MTX2